MRGNEAAYRSGSTAKTTISRCARIVVTQTEDGLEVTMPPYSAMCPASGKDEIIAITTQSIVCFIPVGFHDTGVGADNRLGFRG